MRHDIDTRSLRIALVCIFWGLVMLGSAIAWRCNAYASPPVIDGAVLAGSAHDDVADPPNATSSPSRNGATTASTLPSGWPVNEPPTRAERRLIEVAANHCPLASARHLPPRRALLYLRLEQDAGIPEHLRGISIASACIESAYQVDDVIGDGQRAAGVMQLHELLASHCGPTYARHSPPWSVRCYLHHVARVAKKWANPRLCGPNGRHGRAVWPDVWTLAEAKVAGGNRRYPGCAAQSRHALLLGDWSRRVQRMIAHEKRHAMSCEAEGL